MTMQQLINEVEYMYFKGYTADSIAQELGTDLVYEIIEKIA